MRSRHRPAPDIELIQPEGRSSEWTEPMVEADGVSWQAIAAIVAILIGGVVLLRVWPSPVDRPERVSPLTPPEAREEPTPSRLPGPATEEPDPTYLTRVPGSNLSIIPDVSGVSLLYVNSRGLPTLIDLDTGDRSELHIASEADQYIFMVEKGQVVTDSPAGDASSVLAGDRAFSMLAYRTTYDSPSAVGESVEQALAVIPMCGEFGCSILGNGPTLGRSGDILRLLSEADSDIASLFDPSVWPREGHWLLAPPGSGIEVRLPAPADYSPIYFIRQP